MNRIEMEWVEVISIVPNPLNPRKNFGVKTEDMQAIISNKGWETGITCYRKDLKYVIISGHRRWHAAKELKIGKIPVLIVQPPKSKAEELDRLSSVQGGKVDWTNYEWAKYTFEMWNIWGKCSFRELAKKMGISTSQVSARINVFNYYVHTEIEENLSEGIYTITGLNYLMRWMEQLKKVHPNFVIQYDEDMIRKTMLKKLLEKKVGVQELKNDKYIQLANTEHLKSFVLSTDKSLKSALEEISEEDGKYITESILSTNIAKIHNRILSVNSIRPNNKEESNKIQISLDILRQEVVKKQKEISKMILQ